MYSSDLHNLAKKYGNHAAGIIPRKQPPDISIPLQWNFYVQGLFLPYNKYFLVGPIVIWFGEFEIEVPEEAAEDETHFYEGEAKNQTSEPATDIHCEWIRTSFQYNFLAQC